MRINNANQGFDDLKACVVTNLSKSVRQLPYIQTIKNLRVLGPLDILQNNRI